MQQRGFAFYDNGEIASVDVLLTGDIVLNVEGSYSLNHSEVADGEQ